MKTSAKLHSTSSLGAGHNGRLHRSESSWNWFIAVSTRCDETSAGSSEREDTLHRQRGAGANLSGRA